MGTVTVAGNMLIACMFTVFATKERGKTHANLSRYTPHLCIGICRHSAIHCATFRAGSASDNTDDNCEIKLDVAARESKIRSLDLPLMEPLVT